MSRPVLNRSFLGDLGVGVRSGVKTRVLCSRDCAFPKVGKADQVLRRETRECSRRPGLYTRGLRRGSNREKMGEYLIRYSN